MSDSEGGSHGGSSALLERWVVLAGPGAAAREHGEALIAAYGQPHRRYHTVQHLAAVLDAADVLGDAADELRAVLFAAWFHDAVYEIGGGGGGEGAGADGEIGLSNEEASARLAEAVLAQLGEGPGLIAEVARLVRLTVGHAVQDGDRNGAVLCDADLAILAGAGPDYQRYAAQVRAEYAQIPDELFRPGRAAILRDLLAQPRLFHTRAGFERFEAAARANVGAEIGVLEG